MEADFHLIKVDVDDFLAVGADLRHLAVEVDRISTAGTAGNDNANDFCFLLHDSQSFRVCSKPLIFKDLVG